MLALSDVGPSEPTPQASVRHSRRISPMWIIPLLAIAVGGWLAWDTLSKEGPTITLSFENAEGLQAGQSQLKFKDIVFGTVDSFELTPDHARVLVKVKTTREAEPLLTDTTIFWVVKPRLFAGNIEGLSTLASGSYIGLLPGEAKGKPQRQFVGQEDPPVLQSNVPGHTFELKAAKLGSISLGSPIFFRGLDVGTVLGWDVGDMVESVTIHAFVRAPYDKYVHDETRFWNASGISLKLGATGLEMQFESIRALLLGGVAFDTPAADAGSQMSAENHVFPLFVDEDVATNASYTRVFPLISYFPGSVRGLGPGSEVTIRGIEVGHVTSVRLQFNPATGTIEAPVEYQVQPERIVGIGNKIFKTPGEAVEAMLKQGLRATLQSANLLTGQQSVVLEFFPKAPPANVVMEGTNFVLPTAEGGGFAGLQASASDLLGKLSAVPFDEIGNNLNGILLAANKVANGEQLKQTLTGLAATLAKVKDVVDHVDSGLNPALRQLPEIANNLQKTLANANVLVQSVNNGYGNNTKFNRDLERLLVQANDTLSAIRALSDLLARDPQALIKGRPTGSP